jgi:hypothetical protein
VAAVNMAWRDWVGKGGIKDDEICFLFLDTGLNISFLSRGSMEHYSPQHTHVKTSDTGQEKKRESYHRRLEIGPLVVRSENDSILSQEKRRDKRRGYLQR